MRDARTGREDELQELVQSLRRELDTRGERLSEAWTTEAVEDLRSGRLSGWYRPAGVGVGEIAFYSRRPGRIFGHVHVLPGPAAEERAQALMDRLASDPEVRKLPLNLGVTGLSDAEEASVASRFASTPGRAVVVREGLERRVDDPALLEAEPVPPGVAHVPIQEVTNEALADLDLRGFANSEDARLFGSTDSENLRQVEGILQGNLGRFLDEASTGLLGSRGELAGLLLTVELTPHVGLFADLVIDPPLRGQGLGRYLLRWGLRGLRALGHERARLWVTSGNEAARRLYDRLGFRSYARALIFRQEPAIGSPHPQVER